jgi:hypothetical protein
MRRHLFGGWAFLTFLAARGREGKLQIYAPWITHQEILTGIRDHVEELTARGKLDTGLAEIAKGYADEASLETLQATMRAARERIYSDTKKRYEAWLASAQAEILPLTVEQATKAWEAYFAGGRPFRHAKSRSDLPDGFAFQALMAIAEKVGEVHFIVEDKPFRDACSLSSGIVCHKDIYGFCSSQGLAIDVSAEAQLQKRQLPFSTLTPHARAMLQKKLPGLKMRPPADSPAVTERLDVEAVRNVGEFVLDPNSVIHVAEDEYLVGFSCSSILQCAHSDSGNDQARRANYTIELRGHLLVRAAPDATADELSSDLDSVEVTSLRLAENQDLIKIVRPPVFVTDTWFERYVETITAPERSGLVIVAGSNQPTRKRVAEHLLRVKQRRDPDLGALYLMSYPPEFSNTLIYVESAWGPFAENDLFEKATKTSAKAIALSVEGHPWLAFALEFVTRESGFVVATMKGATSVSAVVRELHSQGKDVALDRLVGVVIVTAANDGRIKFRAATGGEWGDGSWWGILEYDKYVAGYRTRSLPNTEAGRRIGAA